MTKKRLTKKKKEQLERLRLKKNEKHSEIKKSDESSIDRTFTSNSTQTLEEERRPEEVLNPRKRRRCTEKMNYACSYENPSSSSGDSSESCEDETSRRLLLIGTVELKYLLTNYKLISND